MSTPRRPKPVRASTRKRADADPPTVAMVRAVRAKMWNDAGRTVAGLMALVKREAAALDKPSEAPPQSQAPKGRKRNAA